MRAIWMLAMLGTVGACAAVEAPPEPEPEPVAIPLFEPDNIGPWCGYATRLLANPDVEPARKSATEALARERGCALL